MTAPIEKFIEAVAELKVLMPEAHALIKDLRQATKEARAAVGEEVRTTIEAEVAAQIERLGETTEKAMAASVDKVSAEFDRLAKLFLRGTSKRPSLEGIVRNLPRRTG